MPATAAAPHAIGFSILIALAGPRRYHLGTPGGFTVGVGLTASTLGLRHAPGANRITAVLGVRIWASDAWPPSGQADSTSSRGQVAAKAAR
jgi:hypothetical protein